jgi:hypothetical protein
VAVVLPIQALLSLVSFSDSRAPCSRGRAR